MLANVSGGREPVKVSELVVRTHWLPNTCTSHIWLVDTEGSADDLGTLYSVYKFKNKDNYFMKLSVSLQLLCAVGWPQRSNCCQTTVVFPQKLVNSLGKRLSHPQITSSPCSPPSPSHVAKHWNVSSSAVQRRFSCSDERLSGGAENSY